MPHHGSIITDVIEESIIVKGELVDSIKVFSKELSRLNSVHDRLCKKYEWEIAGVGESLPTKLVTFSNHSA